MRELMVGWHGVAACVCVCVCLRDGGAGGHPSYLRVHSGCWAGDVHNQCCRFYELQRMGSAWVSNQGTICNAQTHSWNVNGRKSSHVYARPHPHTNRMVKPKTDKGC